MSEYHICGVLLMARPERAEAVVGAIESLPGVELHANDGGRMVVTVEGAAFDSCADTMDRLATLSGVASSSLVYHEIDTEQQREGSPQ
jgi:nitrate reductase NapD